MERNRQPERRRRRVGGLAIAGLLMILLFWILANTSPGGPAGTTTTSGTTVLSATSSSTGNFLSFLTLPSQPQTTTFETGTNSSNPFGSVGNSTVAGLQQALQGQSGLNAYISARECGLVLTEPIQFCDTFPDNSLDSTKWNSYGAIHVSPGDVQFINGTLVTRTQFYYSKFAEFTVQTSPNTTTPPRPVQGKCPPGWAPGLDIHGQLICYEYAVWGFARGYDAHHILVGLYWEQEGSLIRSHTRAQDGFTGEYIDTVSQWEPAPAGNVDYGINWSVDLSKGGAFVDFIYHVHGSSQVVFFSEHTGAGVPQLTPLALFAAADGTTFTLRGVIVLPAWVQGKVPFVSL